MRVSKKTILLLIVFIASVWLVVAQRHRWNNGDELPDATAELRRIVAGQQQADSLLVDGTIRLYDEKEPDALLETLSFRSYRNGVSFYSRFGPMVVVANKQWMIQVDSSSQRITVQELDPVAQAAMSSAAGIQLLEKIWQDTAVFKVRLNVSQKNRQRVLQIESEQNPEMRSASLTYDPATARLQKAEIRWRKDDQLDADEKKGWVSYISYANKPAFFLDIESIIKSIVVVKNGQLVPGPGYASYELVKMEADEVGMEKAE